MRYFDTSFLMPVFVREPSTDRVERILGQQPAGDVIVSHWTCVEFSSAVARLVRMGEVADEAAVAIDTAFTAYIETSFYVVLPGVADFNLARRFLRRYETGLRAGDALHLAIASNRSAETIYSLDRGLLRAGRLLGLPVDSGGRLP
jgi:predicted nucleic acid-binding protein